MVKKKSKFELVENIKFIIHEQEGLLGGYRVAIRNWINPDGKSTPSKLIKVKYKIQNGKKFFGKYDGFTKEDLNILVEKWDDVIKHMEN